MRSSALALRRSQCSIRSPNSRRRLEKREIELRETARHPAEQNGLGDGVTGGGEMADVIVDKVGRRQAQSLAAAAAVESGRNADIEAFLPDRL
jgi:hypothetical protein